MFLCHEVSYCNFEKLKRKTYKKAALKTRNAQLLVVFLFVLMCISSSLWANFLYWMLSVYSQDKGGSRMLCVGLCFMWHTEKLKLFLWVNAPLVVSESQFWRTYLNSRCVSGWSKVQQNAVKCFVDNGQRSAESEDDGCDLVLQDGCEFQLTRGQLTTGRLLREVNSFFLWGRSLPRSLCTQPRLAPCLLGSCCQHWCVTPAQAASWGMLLLLLYIWWRNCQRKKV